MGNWYEYDFAGKKALLIEDHPLNSWIEQKILEEVGFSVETAENGREGLEKYQASGDEYFDVILMDINMPVMDGLTSAALIRSSGVKGAERIPIIALTTNCFEEDVYKSKKAGMNEHLTKPIEPDILFRCLSEYL